MKIVKEPIGNRSLRGNGPKSRVRIDRAGRGVETWIGNPPLTDPTVIPRNRLGQILDRIEGIGTLVDERLGASCFRCMGPHVDEIPAAEIPPAYVLKDKDVAILFELRGRPKPSLVGV